MLGLDGAQLHHQPVVLGVRHLRIVERVIAIVVPVEKLAQLRRPGGRLALGFPACGAMIAGRDLKPPDRAQRGLKPRHILAQRRDALRRERHALGILHRAGKLARELARRREQRIDGLQRLERPGSTANMLTPRNSSSGMLRRIEGPGLDQARNAEDARPVGVLAVIDLVAPVGEPMRLERRHQIAARPARLADRADTQGDDLLLLARVGRRGLDALRGGRRSPCRLARLRGAWPVAAGTLGAALRR